MYSSPSTSTPSRWRKREESRLTRIQQLVKGSSEGGYEGDQESEIIVTPSRSPKKTKNYYNDNELVRWCTFNTGNCTASEFWFFLKNRLSSVVVDGVIRVQKIKQPNGRSRIDFWTTRGTSDAIKNKLYMTGKTRRSGVEVDLTAPLCKIEGIWKPGSQRHSRTRLWRLAPFRHWNERKNEAPRLAQTIERRTSIATWNVNGLKDKTDELDRVLGLGGVGIMALQETLTDDCKRRVIANDYAIYTRPSDKTFRGQAILVHRSLMSYEVKPLNEKFIIHVKVGGLPGDKPWHFISLYMPSGGKYRVKRTEYWNLVLEEYKNIIGKDREALVVILGDMNEPRQRLAKRIKSQRTGLRFVHLGDNDMTFHRKGTRQSNIDHVLASANAFNMLAKGRVERNWLLSSDHWPVFANVQDDSEAPFVECKKHNPWRFDTGALNAANREFVCHNRWNALAAGNIENEADLEAAAVDFSMSVVDVGIDLDLMRPPRGPKRYMTRKLKRKVEESRKLKQRRENLRQRGLNNKYLDEAYKKAKAAAKQLISEQKKHALRTEITKATDFVRTANMGQFHKWNGKYTGNGRAAEIMRPVQKLDGTLATTRSEIVKRTGEYFKDLLQDDPDKLSSNKDYWKGKAHHYRDEPLPGANEPFKWKQCLIAIRHMSIGTASGHEGTPPEVFKALLNVENISKGDDSRMKDWLENILVAPPEDLLPESPRTPMGKALWRIIEAIWEKERPPTFWNRVMMASLFKSGDPTDLKNYRGISLIVVGFKIVTVMIAQRMERGLEEAGIICKEQAGFRSREEAIGQFVAFSEILKRRRLAGWGTYVTFIDLQKAFDKVMHEALFEVLDAAGVRGKMLNLIKNIYKTSEFCVKIDGDMTDYFQLLRGTRQGCPLSPILFILFMNELVHHVGVGVEIPLNGATGRVQTARMFCQQLLFADDIAGFNEGIGDTQAFLNAIKEWSEKWHMPIGIKKCNVMLVGGSVEDEEELERTVFMCGNERVETTKKYKYLGIVVTDKHGDAEKTDECAHAKVMASRVRAATNSYRNFLRNDSFPLQLRLTVVTTKIIPLGLYGGEWLGLNQKVSDPIQKEVVAALKLCMNCSTKSNIFGELALMYELGVESIDTRMSVARLRLWSKAGSLKTWLKELVTRKHIMRGGYTWVQQSSKRASEYTAAIETVRLTDAHALMHMEEKLGPTGPGTAPVLPWKMSDIIRLAHHNRDRSSRRGAAKSTQLYFDRGYGYSRKVFETAMSMPELARGVTWLAKLRVSGWHSATRQIQQHKHLGTPTTLQEGICPACNAPLGRADEVQHILLHCKKYSSARKVIAPHINMLTKLIADGAGAFESADVDQRAVVDEEVILWLLGGYIPGHRAGEDVLVNPWSRKGVRCNIRESWPLHSDELQLYHVNFGGRTKSHRVQSLTLKAYGFEAVAKFLDKVMPDYMLAVFGEKPRKVHHAYSTTDDNMSLWNSSDVITPISRRTTETGTSPGSEVLLSGGIQWIPTPAQSTESTPCPSPRLRSTYLPSGPQADAFSMAYRSPDSFGGGDQGPTLLDE